MERLENVDDLGIKIPDAGLSEVAVGAFEKRVAIQFGQVRRDAIQHAIDQIAPPAFIVVITRAGDRSAAWQKAGWKSYDPSAQPYGADEVRRERQLYGTGVR